VNEVAPRVHNSGHWTIEGAEVSQFENHLRACLGLPLGATTPVGWSVMANVLGDLPDVAEVTAIPGAHLHLYGKEPRPLRKIGHVTIRRVEPEWWAGAGSEPALAAALQALHHLPH
jgi:5-(carboxyamino)imidazole ribonucleotide synthase